jgi:cytochrome c oxidase subunit 4
MSDHSPEAVQKHIKLYLAIGAALLVGTAITVYAAGLKSGIIVGITIAIIIATIKGSLVAGYFMHLLNERKLIYQVLALTGVFIVVLLGLIIFAYGDQQGEAQGLFHSPAQRVQPHVGHAEHTEGAAHVP